MAKDKIARRTGRMTLIVMASIIAAIVDAMRRQRLPNDTIHEFLDSLERQSVLYLDGAIEGYMLDMIAVIRATVPGND